jgi:hypothetical protein
MFARQRRQIDRVADAALATRQREEPEPAVSPFILENDEESEGSMLIDEGEAQKSTSASSILTPQSHGPPPTMSVLTTPSSVRLLAANAQSTPDISIAAEDNSNKRRKVSYPETRRQYLLVDMEKSARKNGSPSMFNVFPKRCFTNSIRWKAICSLHNLLQRSQEGSVDIRKGAFGRTA